MGTNFYLKPKAISFDEASEQGRLFHIAKRSFGWRSLFEWRADPRIDKVDDILDLLDDKYDAVSEYGDVLSKQEFVDDVVSWKGGGKDVAKSNLAMSLPVYLDHEGNEFCKIDFQ